ncbi:MAG: DUF2442 domain-containing protein [Gallionella sp.]|nr:DUF2442 domain-containing protein [Gallionella sp.]
MNSLAKAVSFDANTMWVDFVDGRKLGVPLAYFPRLLNAMPTQREHFEISGGGSGLHWDEIDEDISVENLLLGIGDRTRSHLMAA